MFIGRKRELKTLQELYQKEGFGMSVIYGRRRIGKSTLIAEFTKDKKNRFLCGCKSRQRKEYGAVFRSGAGSFGPCT